MPDPPLHELTIEALHGRLRSRQVSAAEVVESSLTRIATLNKQLNAFITVLPDAARTAAQQADREIVVGQWRGPLHGIPIAVKDFYDTAGVRTTAAFEPFINRVPQHDAAAVARLKAAGAIIVGKTNMHRLGMGTTGLDSSFGPVRNPWNADYIPGGSSSGSAAAVAAGLCYATLDTDAIGSCRLPAACCGVVGFKATYGLISSKGILDGEQVDEGILWLSHPAITTRAVGDTALILDVLAESSGKHAGEFHRVSAEKMRPRIGVVGNSKAAPEISEAFHAAVDIIKTFAASVVAAAPLDVPPFGDVRAIEHDRRTIAERSFGEIDVLLLPTTTAGVPTVKDAVKNAQALAASHTMFANYFGLPAISVPCGFDKHGLPIGLQVVGKPGDEGSVLRVARQYETAAGIHSKPML